MKNLSDLYDQPPEPRHKGVAASSRYLTMRDGVPIAVDVMLPADLTPEARVPALLVMARYWRSLELRMGEPPRRAFVGPREPLADYLIPRGFAVVAVDARGTGASRGVSRHPWTPEELADYAEVAAWAAAQPWCSGSVGAYGISYEGSTALYLAGAGVPAVRAVVWQEIEFDVYADVILPGGVFNEAFIREWSESNRLLDSNRVSSLFGPLARLLVKGVRPVDADRKERALLRQALQDHQANTDVHRAMARITYRDDPFGETGATLDDFSLFRARERIEAGGCALFAWGSWLDGSSADAVLRVYNTFSNPQIAVIGAWKHEMTRHASPYLKPGAPPDPPQAAQWAAQAQFFEQTLKQGRPPEGKTLFYYTLGAEAWRRSEVFPLPRTEQQTWHFQAGGGLAPDLPPAGEAADTYTVDLQASTGRTNRWHTQMAKPLIYRDRAAEDRRLLTYTSEPLARDLEITGYPVATLHIASSEPDGAFFVYLEEVDERGVVRYLSEGVLRGLHRRLSDEAPPYWMGALYRTFRRADAAPLPVGETVELTFGLQPVSALVRRGRRLRVALAGADRETFARVPAAGTPVWQVARSAARPSGIRLPVGGGGG